MDSLGTTDVPAAHDALALVGGCTTLAHARDKEVWEEKEEAIQNFATVSPTEPFAGLGFAPRHIFRRVFYQFFYVWQLGAKDSATRGDGFEC